MNQPQSKVYGHAVVMGASMAGLLATRPASLAFLHWYIGKVHEAAAHDPQITQRFYQVMHLLAPPSAMFRPDVMIRLARAAARASKSNFAEQVTQS